MYLRNRLPVKNEMSDRAVSQVWGDGYGDSHIWIRGETLGRNAAGEVPDLVERNTAYHCSVCGAYFKHYYCVTPDIFKAIKQAGIASQCTKLENT